ncbi:unnamed protein product [Vicia faba]|uniref:Uncharacterized protein n=1 Tax=Vicia faba TaxID=3906 RepID=A0AAV1B0V1_VICFA|nr:unnamed protein product [Vicia faba]
MLAETWPKSFCKQNKCIANVPSEFTIHGLWPKNNTPPDTYYCKGELFLLNPFQKLNTVWPNLKGINKELWRYEWKKHGTCSEMVLVDYFNHAIVLYEKNNIKDILKMPLTPGGAAALIPGGIANSADIEMHIKILTR